jgi:LemA protein
MLIYTGLVVLIIGSIIVGYNSLVKLKNQAKNAWEDINVQLKRRHDLIPNLVETVRGYASHEKTIFEDVASLRAKATQLDSVKESSETETQLAGAIKTIFAVAESYPLLKADTNFRQLQTQLAEIEDQIQYSRRYYNAVVRDMNTKCQMFPSNIIAGFFGFKELPYFQVNDDERSAVKVDLGVQS